MEGLYGVDMEQMLGRQREVSDVEAVGVCVEEVALEHVADFEQQLCVDARTVKDLIDVCAVAAELLGKPYYAPRLASELLLDEFANKNLAHRQ